MEILNVIDDHSRLCVASVTVAVTRATDVADIFIAAAQGHGTPASVLTDIHTQSRPDCPVAARPAA